MMSPFEGQPGGSVLPPHVARSGVPLILTLYDLIPFMNSHPDAATPELRAELRPRLELVRHADLVLAISEHSAADAVRLLGLRPDRVAVIGGGVSPFFRPASADEDPRAVVRLAVPAVERPYVLSVSATVE